MADAKASVGFPEAGVWMRFSVTRGSIPGYLHFSNHFLMDVLGDFQAFFQGNFFCEPSSTIDSQPLEKVDVSGPRMKFNIWD